MSMGSRKPLPPLPPEPEDLYLDPDADVEEPVTEELYMNEEELNLADAAQGPAFPQEEAEDDEIYENYDPDMPTVVAPPVPLTESPNPGQQAALSETKDLEKEDLARKLQMLLKLRITDQSGGQSRPVVQQAADPRAGGSRGSVESSRSSGYSSESASSSFRMSSEAESEEYYTNLPLHMLNPPTDGKPFIPPTLVEEDDGADEGIAVAAPSPPRLEDQSWFVGDMNRETVTNKLKQVGTDGCFTVRNCSKGGDSPYTLGVLNQGKVWNLILMIRPDGLYGVGKPKPKEATFSSVMDLIEHYQSSSIILAKDGQRGGSVVLKSWPTKP